MWGIKYDRWLQDHIWKTWKQEAQKSTDWLQFHKYSECRIVLRKPEKSIPLETSLNLRINLDRPGSYLILFNRGSADSQSNTTQHLFSPSQAFAPSYQLSDKSTLLPHPDATEPDFMFDRIGTEEFIGIVINQELDLNWLKNPDYCFEWQGKNLEQVWEQLQRFDRDNWQVFYRDFNVI